MKPKPRDASLCVSTRIRAGDPLRAAACYVTRNFDVINCALVGWDSGKYLYCKGDAVEMQLKACLAGSTEEGWYRSFPGCTDADMCAGYRPPCRQKCFHEMIARGKIDKNRFSLDSVDQENTAEWDRCLRTCSD